MLDFIPLLITVSVSQRGEVLEASDTVFRRLMQGSYILTIALLLSDAIALNVASSIQVFLALVLSLFLARIFNLTFLYFSIHGQPYTSDVANDKSTNSVFFSSPKYPAILCSHFQP